MKMAYGKRSSAMLLALIQVLSYVFSQLILLATAADTIFPGQSLSGNQTIVSKNGIFELGFFTIAEISNYRDLGNKENYFARDNGTQDQNSDNGTQESDQGHYYIGIWYKRLPEKTVVWVANREAGVSNPSVCQLSVSQDGNLVLTQSNSSIWSSSLTSPASNSTIAVLLDSGNLVLRDRSNFSSVVWQSFDHPTDTWLPGASIGLNKISGEYISLTSWQSFYNPSRGLFHLEVENSKQFLIRITGSGYSIDTVYYSGTFPQGVNISDNGARYFTYQGEPYTRIVLYGARLYQLSWLDMEKDSHGNLIQYWSSVSAKCSFGSYCGPFSIRSGTNNCSCLPGFQVASLKDWNSGYFSEGCAREIPLLCEGKDSTDSFSEVALSEFPDNPHVVAAKSKEECKLACLSNCSCAAFTYNNMCGLWRGDLINALKASGVYAGTIQIRLGGDASNLPTRRHHKSANVVVVGILAAVLTVLAVGLILVYRYRAAVFVQNSRYMEGLPIRFSYTNLLRATKNFSEKLGKGGFGTVFKGTLPGSIVVAVKKLEGLAQGEKQFRNEVSTLGMIQHVNLVRLLGFCSEGTRRLLVYEYMPYGSLDYHLFGKTSMVLDWSHRYKIALGTARGLAYLHEQCRECIIHCDIKPENVLLDDEFCPKVADFGLAKLLGRDFSRVLTTMRGTVGYLAPEWISGLPITTKADVYSFGMMLFEMISGRRNTEKYEDRYCDYFPIWAASKVSEGEVLCLLDYRLENNANIEELRIASWVACWCIQDDEEDRPSMGQVVQMLEGIVEVKLPPIPRFLENLVYNQNESEALPPGAMAVV